MKQGNCTRCNQTFISRTLNRKYCTDCQIDLIKKRKNEQKKAKALAKKELEQSIKTEVGNIAY